MSSPFIAPDLLAPSSSRAQQQHHQQQHQASSHFIAPLARPPPDHVDDDGDDAEFDSQKRAAQSNLRPAMTRHSAAVSATELQQQQQQVPVRSPSEHKSAIRPTHNDQSSGRPVQGISVPTLVPIPDGESVVTPPPKQPLVTAASSIASLTASAPAPARPRITGPSAMDEERARRRQQEQQVAADAAYARQLADGPDIGIDIDDDSPPSSRVSSSGGSSSRAANGKRKLNSDEDDEDDAYVDDGEIRARRRLDATRKKRQKGTAASRPKASAASRTRKERANGADASHVDHEANAINLTDDADTDVPMGAPHAAAAATYSARPATAVDPSFPPPSEFDLLQRYQQQQQTHPHPSLLHRVPSSSAPARASSATSSSPTSSTSEQVRLQQRQLHSLIEEQRRARRDALQQPDRSTMVPVTRIAQVQYYKLTEPECGAAPSKKSCVGCPNCLHGVTHRPAKVGIWATPPTQLKSLGVDPASRQRDGNITHAGLKNLGATCYMNTLFQCLFMNAHFRNAIYRFRSARQRSSLSSGQAADSMDVDTSSSTATSSEDTAVADAQDRIVCELQNLFARLEFGRASFEDPHRIVSSLGLKRGEQQDINEFNNLFLQVIDSRLKLTRMAGVESLIDDEFRGTVVNAIECVHCQKRSETRHTFYDLTLQIAKLKTVRECLIRHMQKEYLQGSNQYKCSHCRSLQDAHRSTVIAQLPPVLNLQLLRFGYDQTTDTKKKLQDNIAIPAVIDLTPFTREEEIDKLSLELAMQQKSPKPPAASSPPPAAAAAATSPARNRERSPRARRPSDADAPILPLASPAASSPRSPSARRSPVPSTDNLSSAAASTSSPSHLYELTAILRHKGMSAHHGHYIADIRDPDDPTKWWRFDDDSCRPLAQFDDGSAPATADSGAKPKRGGKKSKKGAQSKSATVISDDEDAYTDKSSKKSKVDDADDDVDEDDSSEEAGTPVASDEAEVVIVEEPKKATSVKMNLDNISSRNAYMLVYTRVGRPRAARVPRTALTPAMEQQVQESDLALTQQIDAYKHQKEQLIHLIEVRKQKCQKVIDQEAVEIKEWDRASIMHVIQNESDPESPVYRDLESLSRDPAGVALNWLNRDLECGYFVHAAWLKAWMTGVAPSEETVAAAKGSNDDVIDITDDDFGPDGHVSAALMKQLQATDAAATSEAEPPTEEEQKAASASTVEDVPTSSPVPAASSATAAATASVPASAASPASRAPPVLRHLLWPGDLVDSLQSLLCEHGKPRPGHADLKRVSLEAWQILQDDNQRQKAHLLAESNKDQPIDADVVPPPLSSSSRPRPSALRTDDLCLECCQVLAARDNQTQIDLATRDALYDEIVKFKEAFGSRGAVGMKHNSMWLSKSFLRKWCEKASKEYGAKFTQTSTELDINQSLTCPHQLLAIDEKDRYAVSQAIWSGFASFYPSSSPFSAHQDPCPQCQESQDALEERDDEWSQRMNEDKQNIKGKIFPGFLNPNKAPPTSSDLLLLPGAWATAYHNHITEKVKRIPPPLNTRDILCEQHGRLLFNPVPFDFRPTEPLPEPYHVRGSKEGEIAVCERKFLDSIIRDGKYVENDTDAQYIELVIKEKAGDSLHDKFDWNRFTVKTNPTPCPDCIERRLEQSRRKEVEWAYSSLFVRVLHAGASPPSVVTAPPPSATGRPRRSAARRPKAGASDVSHEFETQIISSSDPLSKVKLNIYQESDVPPGQQQIWYNGRQLDTESTLADLEVPPDAELWVVRDLDGDADISSFFADAPRAGRAARPEAGFAGTALSSAPRARPTAAEPTLKTTTTTTTRKCTFENESGHLACTICKTPSK